MPASKIATISSAVATGRSIKIFEGFMRGSRSSVCNCRGGMMLRLRCNHLHRGAGTQTVAAIDHYPVAGLQLTLHRHPAGIVGAWLHHTHADLVVSAHHIYIGSLRTAQHGRLR